MRTGIAWVALVMLGTVSGCVVDPTYTYCASSSECEVAESCFEVTTNATGGGIATSGAFCSQECTSDLDCERNLGFPGSCMVVDDIGSICFQECDYRSDCFSSSDCYDFTDVSRFTNRVCLPIRL